MKKLIYISLLFVSYSCSIFKPTYKVIGNSLAEQYAGTITAEELKIHLEIIASDEYEGRETGKNGQRMTADYLKKELDSYGLTPGNKGNSFQYFKLNETQKPEATFSFHNKDFVYAKDFYFFQNYAKFESFQVLAEELVPVEYGIVEGKRNDYDSKEVKGKIVVIKVESPKEFSSWDWKKKVKLAEKMGAKQVIFASDKFESTLNRLHHFLTKSSMTLATDEVKKKAEFIPFFFFSDELLSEIYRLEKTEKDFIERYPLYETLEFMYQKLDGKIESSNVLGLIEGSDPVLKNEYIILTAHYDHLGIQDGEIYNGADDDGTGTVALLEIAQAFQKAKEEGNGPKRSILIMPVSGEEKGLLGSRYYSENPVFPLENTVANLNIDMIGRLDEYHTEDNYVYVIGADKISQELHDVNEATNKKYTQLELDYRFNKENDPNRFYYRSDHYNFAKNGIPVIFYFSGVHEDYHQPTDEVHKIMFPKVEKITQLVFYTAWELANKPSRLEINK